MNYYVYAYLDPRKSGNYNYELNGETIHFDFEPFYIGKGKNDRMFYHLKLDEKDSNHIKKNKIKHLQELNMKPIINKIYEFIDFQSALNFEKQLIILIGRITQGNGPLSNMTDGGMGGDTFSGKHHTEKAKKKMSAAKKGCKGVFSNKKHTETSKKKMSEARKDVKPWNKGLQNCYSPETLNAMSIANSGKVSWNKGLTKEIDKRVCISEDTKIKMRKSNKKAMKGKTVYSIWVEKYGKEIADKKEKERRYKLSIKGKNKIPWNKGLTKETDERVLQSSESMKNRNKDK